MRKVIILVLVLCLVSGTVLAEEGNKEEKEDEVVHLEAGYMKYIDDVIEVSEGVTVIKDENTINAPQGTIYRDEDKAIFTDNKEQDVIVERTEETIKSKKLTSWFEKDEYIFEKDVRLKHQEDDEDDEMYMETSYLEVYEDEDLAKTDRSVYIEYDEKEITGDQARYNDKKEIMKIKENVKILEKDGDWIKGDLATFYLDSDKDEFTMDKNVEMEMKLDDN